MSGARVVSFADARVAPDFNNPLYCADTAGGS